jgi:hypothetical protein
MISRIKYWWWLRKCKSFSDVLNWLHKNFEYDMVRLFDSRLRVQKGRERIRAKSPWETFKSKAGICYESAVFSKYSLNKIDPNYRAEIIYVCIRKDLSSHVVCSFFVNDKMFVIDYGRMTKKYNGIFGPFNDVEDYANHYISTHPVYSDYQFCRTGWPSWRSFEKW